MPTLAGRARPIEKFAETVAKCGPESARYGQCILADYQATRQDMCKKEFLALKDCYLKAAKKK